MYWLIRIAALLGLTRLGPNGMGSTMAEGDSGTSASPPDEFHKSVENMRATAKTLLGTFGAIATAAVGTSPLTGFGKLDAWSGRFWVAVVGLLITVAASAILIRFVMAVEKAGDVNLGLIAKGQDRITNDLITSSPELLGGYRDLQALRQDYYNQITKQYNAIEADDQPSLEVAHSKAIYLTRRVIEPLLDVVRYRRVKDSFDEWIGKSAIIAAVVAVGLIAFIWAANPPDDDPPAAANYRTPVYGELTIANADIATKVNGALDQGCGDVRVGDVLKVIVLASPGEESRVLNANSNDTTCAPVTFSVETSFIQPILPAMTPSPQALTNLAL